MVPAGAAPRRSTTSRDNRACALEACARRCGPRPPTSTSAPTSTASPRRTGGTHEGGLRSGVVKAVRNYIETHDLAPKGVTLTAEDIREGIAAILSAYVVEPQFQGQTKDRLNNPETTAQVDGAVRPALEKWLNDNKTVAEPIVARIILAARAREASRAASQQVTRKTAVRHRLNLPGKLADCSSTNPARERALHRRGRLRRRLGQAGPRPAHAGHPAAARQGAQRRAGLDARRCAATRSSRTSSRALGCGIGAGLRRHQAALRQDLPADGRRQRRPPHLHAAAHVLLPAPARADRERQRLHRPAAALPDRHRQGDLLGARRRRPRPHPAGARPRATPSPTSCASRAWAR